MSKQKRTKQTNKPAQKAEIVEQKEPAQQEELVSNEEVVEENNDQPEQEVQASEPEEAQVEEQTEEEEAPEISEGAMIQNILESNEPAPVVEQAPTNAFIVYLGQYCEQMDHKKRTLSTEEIAVIQGQLFSNLFLQLAVTEDYDRSEAILFLLNAIDSGEYNALNDIYLYRCVDMIKGVSQESLLAYSKFLYALTELADPETRADRFGALRMETWASVIHPNALALVEELGHVCNQ